jgi:hypothetical protein
VGSLTINEKKKERDQGCGEGLMANGGRCDGEEDWEITLRSVQLHYMLSAMLICRRDVLRPSLLRRATARTDSRRPRARAWVPKMNTSRLRQREADQRSEGGCRRQKQSVSPRPSTPETAVLLRPPLVSRCLLDSQVQCPMVQMTALISTCVGVSPLSCTSPCLAILRSMRHHLIS